MTASTIIFKTCKFFMCYKIRMSRAWYIPLTFIITAAHIFIFEQNCNRRSSSTTIENSGFDNGKIFFLSRSGTFLLSPFSSFQVWQKITNIERHPSRTSINYNSHTFPVRFTENNNAEYAAEGVHNVNQLIGKSVNKS